jgi:hypothetical protein
MVTTDQERRVKEWMATLDEKYPYEAYLREMDRLRRVYQNGGYIRDPQTDKLVYIGQRPVPPWRMPLDLRAYVVARRFDGDRYTFGKILPEIIKHKDKLHPFVRRYLLERLRAWRGQTPHNS